MQNLLRRSHKPTDLALTYPLLLALTVGLLFATLRSGSLAAWSAQFIHNLEDGIVATLFSAWSTGLLALSLSHSLWRKDGWGWWLAALARLVWLTIFSLLSAPLISYYIYPYLGWLLLIVGAAVVVGYLWWRRAIWQSAAASPQRLIAAEPEDEQVRIGGGQ